MSRCVNGGAVVTTGVRPATTPVEMVGTVLFPASTDDDGMVLV